MIIGKIPIRTHIITERDDIVEVVKTYTGEIVLPGDIVAVAESMVAISQGRAILPDKVKPRLLARFLCHFPARGGSLATPAAMQLAIQEAGIPRILLGVVCAGLGRLVGRRGFFYLVAGRHLAQIDDVAGTMWPFEKHIILGPKDPQKVVDGIKQAVDVDAIIADVNDIGNVDILAATGGVDHGPLIEYLSDNPFGNDDQQTPIVILVSESNISERDNGVKPS